MLYYRMYSWKIFSIHWNETIMWGIFPVEIHSLKFVEIERKKYARFVENFEGFFQIEYISIGIKKISHHSQRYRLRLRLLRNRTFPWTWNRGRLVRGRLLADTEKLDSIWLGSQGIFLIPNSPFRWLVKVTPASHFSC